MEKSAHDSTMLDSLTSFSFRSADKGQKLKEARELQVFEQEVEDIEDWIADMEHQLASEDLGKDLISVNNLLKSYQVRTMRDMLLRCYPIPQMLENDIQTHQDRIDDITMQVRRFRDANHFMIDRIEDRGREIVTKLANLSLFQIAYLTYTFSAIFLKVLPVGGSHVPSSVSIGEFPAVPAVCSQCQGRAELDQ